MVNFLGLDYWTKVEGIANGDEEFKIKSRAFVASFTFNVTDSSVLPAIYMKFDDGKVTEVRELAEGERTDFTLEGPYDIWIQVNKGEIEGANAIMTRQLQFKGNVSEIIRYSKAFLRLFQVMQQVPVEY
ncbi:MAG: SCP2 sterol-binding domain-containing protein [Candidatus Bathyarchaeota archaeon]|jgi:putative sterol carrier protein|nr:SCP2 sterol-binding domain-containing protein [Candidatus Bathyarchaeota archaeon]MDP7443370.1 SCP2 sterol-binding domain-containing protein [Candidatus Bathyarchaeota archaeon]